MELCDFDPEQDLDKLVMTTITKILPTSHVVHTVGPIYNSNSNPASLSSAYRYPYDEAATVVISVVREFRNEFKEIHFVMFLQDIYQVWVNKTNDLMKN
ncbi:hypothetical protein AHAS_Ahas02G0034100 [Arachis hypogaea]